MVKVKTFGAFVVNTALLLVVHVAFNCAACNNLKDEARPLARLKLIRTWPLVIAGVLKMMTGGANSHEVTQLSLVDRPGGLGTMAA